MYNEVSLMTQQPSPNPNQQPVLTSGLSLRLSIMVISLLSSLLLWVASFSPIFIGLFLSSCVSLFFYEILGIVDPQDSLSIQFNRDGVEGTSKISGQFVGATALFFVVWIFSTLYLEIEKRNRVNLNTELKILLQKNVNVEPRDSDYIYIRKPFEDVLDKIQNNNSAGKLNLPKTLKELYDLDEFDPILVTIRNNCKNKEGLCLSPSKWFETQIVGVDPLLSGDKVSVCKGHDYLAGKTINFSSDTLEGPPWNFRDRFPLDKRELMNINKDTPIEVSATINRNCLSKNQYPAFKVSEQLRKPMRESFKTNKIYVRTVQD